jgi:uncharacterized Ntn-hydrolase superfamily protein
MTYSIVAHDGDKHGIGVCTAGVPVGAIAPFVGPDGAIATQSYYVSTRYGVTGLRLLREGLSVGDALRGLLNADDQGEKRQVHGIDARGDRYAHSGRECLDWAGDRIGDTYTLAGNRLTDEGVLEAMEDEYLDRDELELTPRLISSIEAGMEVGGDQLGKRSAAVQVYAPEPCLYHDLRVDEHETPIAELRRIYDDISELESEFATSEKELGRW